MSGMGFFSFAGFEIIFVLMFTFVILIFIMTAIRGFFQWHRNNQSPRLTVSATVVSKREEVTHHHQTADHTMHMSSSTWYYVTFQVESGDRMELSVTGPEYGILAEGDFGQLTFQGTRYLSFERLS